MGNRARSVGRVRAATVGMSVIALLMTGCSNGAEDDEQINGADGGKEQTEEPESTEEKTPDPANDGIERPDIQVADDLELIFEDRETGDPVKDAILLDNEWQIKSVYEVFTTFDRENSSVGFYTSGQALINAMGMLDRVISDGETSMGAMRYYKRAVTLVDEESATVTYCRDFTEVATKDFETGEIVEEADSDAKPTAYVARLERNDADVWQTVAQQAEPGAEGC